LRVGQRGPLRSPPRQRAKEVNAPLAQLRVGDRLPHQGRNDGALILSPEGFIELSFDVIGDAEIDRGHIWESVIEDFNNLNDIGISMAVKLCISRENTLIREACRTARR
jgi:hypothetical protein